MPNQIDSVPHGHVRIRFQNLIPEPISGFVLTFGDGPSIARRAVRGTCIFIGAGSNPADYKFFVLLNYMTSWAKSPVVSTPRDPVPQSTIELWSYGTCTSTEQARG